MNTTGVPKTLFSPAEGWGQEGEDLAAGESSLPNDLDLSPAIDSVSLSAGWYSASTVLDSAIDDARANQEQLPEIPDTVPRLCDLWHRSTCRMNYLSLLSLTLRTDPRLCLKDLAARAKEAWLAAPLPQLADEPYQTAENANTFYACHLSEAIEGDQCELVDHLLGLRFPTHKASIQQSSRPASLEAIWIHAPSLFDPSDRVRKAARATIGKKIASLKTPNL